MSGNQGGGSNIMGRGGQQPGWAQQGGGGGFAGPAGFGPRRQAIFNERFGGGQTNGGNMLANQQSPMGDQTNGGNMLGGGQFGGPAQIGGTGMGGSVGGFGGGPMQASQNLIGQPGPMIGGQSSMPTQINGGGSLMNEMQRGGQMMQGGPMGQGGRGFGVGGGGPMGQQAGPGFQGGSFGGGGGMGGQTNGGNMLSGNPMGGQTNGGNMLAGPNRQLRPAMPMLKNRMIGR